MKKKLLNLFNDVGTFNLLTISKNLLADEIYMKLITDTLLDNLSDLYKQAWVKSPHLAIEVKNLHEVLSLEDADDKGNASHVSRLFANCLKLSLSIDPLQESLCTINPSDQMTFEKLIRLELTSVVLIDSTVAACKQMIASCPNIRHFKLHVLQCEMDNLDHVNSVL